MTGTMAPYIIWALLGAALVTAQTLAMVGGARFPTVGDFADVLMRRHVTRWIVLIFWVWLGWHIYVRR